MNQTRLDLYTDYLTVTFGYATATGLSQLLDGEISHDAISRLLSEREYTSKDLWKQVKKQPFPLKYLLKSYFRLKCCLRLPAHAATFDLR